jgi:altronate dehydratase small subunit
MKPALVISERDNVATALETLEPGRSLTLGPIALTVQERIPHGHKVALVDIAAGQPVIKYGSPIGLAITDIQSGEHVHVHNLASSRGRGDLESLVNAPEPRLAEPSDSGPGPSELAEDEAGSGGAAAAAHVQPLSGSSRAI